MYRFIGFSLLLHGLLIAVFLLYGRLVAPNNLYLGGNSNTISIVALNYNAIKPQPKTTPIKTNTAKQKPTTTNKLPKPLLPKPASNNNVQTKNTATPKVESTTKPASKPVVKPASNQANTQKPQSNTNPTTTFATTPKVDVIENTESKPLQATDNTVTNPQIATQNATEDSNAETSNAENNAIVNTTKKPLELKDLNQQDSDSIKKYLDNNKQNTVLYNEELEQEQTLENLPLSDEDKVSLQQALYGCGYNINLILDEDIDINLKIDMNPDASINHVNLISYTTNSKYGKQKILQLVNNVINSLGKEKCKYLPLPLNNYSGWSNFTFKLTIKGFFYEQ